MTTRRTPTPARSPSLLRSPWVWSGAGIAVFLLVVWMTGGSPSMSESPARTSTPVETPVPAPTLARVMRAADPQRSPQASAVPARAQESRAIALPGSEPPAPGTAPTPELRWAAHPDGRPRTAVDQSEILRKAAPLLDEARRTLRDASNPKRAVELFDEAARATGGAPEALEGLFEAAVAAESWPVARRVGAAYLANHPAGSQSARIQQWLADHPRRPADERPR